MPESLRRIFPELSAEELDRAEERLRRYLSIAIAVERSDHLKKTRLTHSHATGSVNVGKVDPDQLRNTG
jgi:hypothetical protein